MPAAIRTTVDLPANHYSGNQLFCETCAGSLASAIYSVGQFIRVLWMLRAQESVLLGEFAQPATLLTGEPRSLAEVAARTR